MITKSYSDIAAEEFNAADYPALKHFWPCKQPASDFSLTPPFGTLLDIVGNANAGMLSGASGTGMSVTMPFNAAQSVPNGLTAPGGKSCLLIATGDWGGTTAGFILGDTTMGISVGNGSVGGKVWDGANAENCIGSQTPSASTTRVMRITGDGTTFSQLMSFEASSSGTLDTYGDVLTSSLVTSLPALSPGVYANTSFSPLYGMAFFVFSGPLPPKEVCMAAAAWLDYQWRHNPNPVMYPGFKGLL